VEAQGIEPWSEYASETASTCIGPISCLFAGPASSRPVRRSASCDSRCTVVRRRRQPARLCDTVGTPQAGFRHRRCFSELSSAYAASASSELAVDTFQTVLPGAWTWARSNSLNEPVEARELLAPRPKAGCEADVCTSGFRRPRRRITASRRSERPRIARSGECPVERCLNPLPPTRRRLTPLSRPDRTARIPVRALPLARRCGSPPACAVAIVRPRAGWSFRPDRVV
jgi:hypothetical protein